MSVAEQGKQSGHVGRDATTMVAAQFTVMGTQPCAIVVTPALAERRDPPQQQQKSHSEQLIAIFAGCGVIGAWPPGLVLRPNEKVINETSDLGIHPMLRENETRMTWEHAWQKLVHDKEFLGKVVSPAPDPARTQEVVHKCSLSATAMNFAEMAVAHATAVVAKKTDDAHKELVDVALSLFWVLWCTLRQRFFQLALPLDEAACAVPFAFFSPLDFTVDREKEQKDKARREEQKKARDRKKQAGPGSFVASSSDMTGRAPKRKAGRPIVTKTVVDQPKVDSLQTTDAMPGKMEQASPSVQQAKREEEEEEQKSADGYTGEGGEEQEEQQEELPADAKRRKQEKKEEKEDPTYEVRDDFAADDDEKSEKKKKKKRKQPAGKAATEGGKRRRGRPPGSTKLTGDQSMHAPPEETDLDALATRSKSDLESLFKALLKSTGDVNADRKAYLGYSDFAMCAMSLVMAYCCSQIWAHTGVPPRAGHEKGRTDPIARLEFAKELLRLMEGRLCSHKRKGMEMLSSFGATECLYLEKVVCDRETLSLQFDPWFKSVRPGLRQLETVQFKNTHHRRLKEQKARALVPWVLRCAFVRSRLAFFEGFLMCSPAALDDRLRIPAQKKHEESKEEKRESKHEKKEPKEDEPKTDALEHRVALLREALDAMYTQLSTHTEERHTRLVDSFFLDDWWMKTNPRRSKTTAVTGHWRQVVLFYAKMIMRWRPRSDALERDEDGHLDLKARTPASACVSHAIGRALVSLCHNSEYKKAEGSYGPYAASVIGHLSREDLREPKESDRRFMLLRALGTDTGLERLLSWNALDLPLRMPVLRDNWLLSTRSPIAGTESTHAEWCTGSSPDTSRPPPGFVEYVRTSANGMTEDCWHPACQGLWADLCDGVTGKKDDIVAKLLCHVAALALMLQKDMAWAGVLLGRLMNTTLHGMLEGDRLDRVLHRPLCAHLHAYLFETFQEKGCNELLERLWVYIVAPHRDLPDAGAGDAEKTMRDLRAIATAHLNASKQSGEGKEEKACKEAALPAAASRCISLLYFMYVAQPNEFAMPRNAAVASTTRLKHRQAIEETRELGLQIRRASTALYTLTRRIPRAQIVDAICGEYMRGPDVTDEEYSVMLRFAKDMVSLKAPSTQERSAPAAPAAAAAAAATPATAAAAAAAVVPPALALGFSPF